jgi:hypothetical protein
LEETLALENASDEQIERELIKEATAVEKQREILKWCLS